MQVISGDGAAFELVKTKEEVKFQQGGIKCDPERAIAEPAVNK
jgi:hypothetical protein